MIGGSESQGTSPLAHARDAILTAWRATASKLPSAAGLSEDELLDCVPEYIDCVMARLEGGECEERLARIVDAHVVSRLRQGYGLDEIVSEYASLAHCVSQVVRDSRELDEVIALLGRTAAATVETYQRHVIGDEQDEKRWVRRLDALFDSAITQSRAATLPLDEASEIVRRALGTDAAAVSLLDGDTIEVRGAAGIAAPLRALRIPLASTDFGARLTRASDSGVLLEEFELDKIVPQAAALGVRAALGHPIRAHGVTLGAVFAASLEARPFTPTQHRILRTLARRLGQLAENAQLIERLRDAVAELQRSNELRERFVAVLAHDLRAPIGAARLNAEMLVHRSGLDPAIATTAQRLIRSLERTDRMIRDLLDVSRVRAGNPLPLKLGECELRPILRALSEELELSFGKRFVLDVTEDAACAHCIWDADEVHRALWNLAANAVKYGASDRPVTIRASRVGNELALAVHNEGEPIPGEYVAQMFAPYGQASSTSTKSGWGLGLTLVRAAAEAHGGRASVVSDSESGTTFTITLPLTAVAAMH